MLDRLLNPISTQNPAGEDARYGERFIALRGFVSQLESPSGAEVDWTQVATLAREILTHEAKDLQVACYLAVALAQLERATGVEQGIDLIYALTNTYADTLFPTVSRGRRRERVCTWYVGQLESLLDETGGESRGNWLPHALEHLPQIFEMLGVQGPSLRELSNARERQERRSQPAKQEHAMGPKPSEARPSLPKPRPAGVPQQQADVRRFVETSLAHNGTRQTLASLNHGLVGASHRLRSADPSCPTGYRLLCFGLWSHMDAIVGDAGTVFEPGSLRLLYQAKKWPQLVEEAVGRLVQSRLQLEYVWFVLQGLKGQGSSFEGACQAVEGTTRDFALRLPKVLEHTLRRVAEHREIAAWIEGLSPEGGDVPPPIEPNPGAALSSEPESRRQRFLTFVALAQDLVSRGKVKHGALTYYGLWREAEERGLAHWEPELVVRCLEGYLAACSGIRGRTKSHLAEVCERLAQLAPRVLEKYAAELLPIAC